MRDRDKKVETEGKREKETMGGSGYIYALDCGDGITGVCSVQIHLTVLIKYEKKIVSEGFSLGLKERRIIYQFWRNAAIRH